MSANPMEVIEATIRSAFTSYPRRMTRIGEVRIGSRRKSTRTSLKAIAGIASKGV